MDTKAKKIEIKSFQTKFKAEMPRVIKEVEVYENALAKGVLKKSPSPSPQFKVG